MAQPPCRERAAPAKWSATRRLRSALNGPPGPNRARCTSTDMFPLSPRPIASRTAKEHAIGRSRKRHRYQIAPRSNAEAIRPPDAHAPTPRPTRRARDAADARAAERRSPPDRRPDAGPLDIGPALRRVAEPRLDPAIGHEPDQGDDHVD